MKNISKGTLIRIFALLVIVLSLAIFLGGEVGGVRAEGGDVATLTPTPTFNPELSVTATATTPLTLSTKSDKEELHWQEYTDDRYGFSIYHPSDWFINPADLSSLGSVTSISSFNLSRLDSSVSIGEVAPGVRVDIGLITYDKPSDVALIDWVAPDPDIENHLISQSFIDINGIQGVRQAFERGNRTDYITFIPSGTKVYFFAVITYGSLDSKTNELIYTEEILQSFVPGMKVLDKQPTRQYLYFNDSENDYALPDVIASAPSGYRLPFSGSKIITCGPGCSTWHKGRSSEAIDFSVSENTRILATKSGDIVYATYGWNDRFGNLLKLDHGDGNRSWYAHLNSFVKTTGSFETGEYVADSGDTGNSEGPHLHFEVRNSSNYSIWIRDLPGISWDSGDANSPCVSGTDGVANGPSEGSGSCDAISLPLGYAQCAEETGYCNFSGSKQVYYGVNNCYAVQTHTDGVNCSNNIFGDPVPGTGKYCYIEKDSPPPTDCNSINSDGAYFFDQDACNGENIGTKSQAHFENLTDYGWNDRAESVYVKNGWSTRVFQDIDAGGATSCLTHSMWDLNQDNYQTDSGRSMHQDFSSIQIFNNTSCNCTKGVEFLGQSPYLTVTPEKNFSIFFDILNSGSCAWRASDGYYLEGFDDLMGANSHHNLPENIVPGEAVRFTINLTAPSTPGSYRTSWMMSKNGNRFGPWMFIDITVEEPFQYPVQLHDEKNYGGTYYYLTTPGAYSYDGVFNDQTRSIHIEDGWSVKFFEHNRLTGGSACRNGDDPDLSNDAYGNAHSMDESITSLWVFDSPDCPFDYNGGVRFWADAYFWGDNIGITSPGYIGQTSLDNQYSSVRVHPGWSVQVYRDANLSGPSACFEGFDADLSNNTYNNGDPMDNSITSYILFDQLGCPTSHTTSTKPADFDGDGDTDVSIYRRASGRWFVKDQFMVEYGTADDIPVPCDYDGDGDSDVAVYRPSTGIWFVKGQFSTKWGSLAGDIPVPGDYDGDGICDIAIYRRSTGSWFVKDQFSISYGTLAGDIPVPGDYDGDGTTDVAIFRSSKGNWFVKDQFSVTYGTLAGDIPVPGDYDGDGTTDVAIFRSSKGNWFVKDQFSVTYGTLAGDIPIPGDYDGDGNTDIAIFRSSTGKWFIKGQFSTTYGTLADDYPLPVRDTNGDGDPYE